MAQYQSPQPQGQRNVTRFQPDHQGNITAAAAQQTRFLSELPTRVTEELKPLMPVLLSQLGYDDAAVVRECIVSGTHILVAVLEEISLQLRGSGGIERWLQDVFSQLLIFKNKVCDIVLEHVSVGVKALAVKFLEVYFLLFTSEANECEGSSSEGSERGFIISEFLGQHPLFDPALVSYDMKTCLDFLLNLLKRDGNLPSSLTIVAINCLANIARRRPAHYNTILSALLGFDPAFDTVKGSHSASIQYSLKTAFLGFLRCIHHPFLMESRDKLLWALRSMNPGESMEQSIRQVDKLSRSIDRTSRDRSNKDDLSSNMAVSGGVSVKKVHLAEECPVYDSKIDDNMSGAEVNGDFLKKCLSDSSLAAVEQMIALIGAMIAEGERGVDSLEILISQIQPELLADIVIVSMKHLPIDYIQLPRKLGDEKDALQKFSSDTAAYISPSAETSTCASLALSPHQVSAASLSAPEGALLTSDDLPTTSLMVDPKRDPRRDPRRLDPRRFVAPSASDLAQQDTDSGHDSQLGSEMVPSRPGLNQDDKKQEISVPPTVKDDPEQSSNFNTSSTNRLDIQESQIFPVKAADTLQSLDILSSELSQSPLQSDAYFESRPSEKANNLISDSDCLESDQYLVGVSGSLGREEFPLSLPPVPSYAELTTNQIKSSESSAILRIIESHKYAQGSEFVHARQSLLAHMASLSIDGDVIMEMLQKHINFDFQHHKGHDLAMYVLYHLLSVMASESEELQSSSFFSLYERFLVAVAKSLLNSLPASDKSFSRFLGEVPLLTESAFKLLEDLCQSYNSDQHGKDIYDGDRITQGLGTAWNLILVRPLARETCLNITLKCTVHPHDEVRAKAIRLVANKLYSLSYASDAIEEFAKSKLFYLINERSLEYSEHRNEVSKQEPAGGGCISSEPSRSESDSTSSVPPTSRGAQNVTTSEAQRYAALFFALCTKKTSLLQVVFDVYGRATKALKQTVHRHIPAILRNLGSSYGDLVKIISDPPEGSENLLLLVLQMLTEETTPSPDLIATVKMLYETKLKDAAILIPMLSALSKDEVLPIFPRLVNLPMEKFQLALARILEGSAHTGPALTPSEVLIAIHDINPDRDGIPLKKIMDACTACFEQRTVFTQHVLAKALNHLVDQIPIPLLFMRTVIQAIDAFPTLVDHVMEILSKLVSKQIWKMPKLWVGFLKLASQTQPHSFPVLLQLPTQQLDVALNRHPNLRAPLSAYASQPNISNSLPRSILAVLGLVNDAQQQQQTTVQAPSIYSSDSGGSFHGAALT